MMASSKGEKRGDCSSFNTLSNEGKGREERGPSAVEAQRGKKNGKESSKYTKG